MNAPIQGSSLPPEMPLVGRRDVLEEVGTLFGERADTPPLAFFTGEGGVGKSRLAATVSREARRRGWEVAYGRAYPVETGIPYALVSDAFVPLLREIGESALAVLTRGLDAGLHQLFPALSNGAALPEEQGDPRELRSRLFWNFTKLLEGLGERAPLLVVLEDIQWANDSSLSLLHFVARNLNSARVRVLCTYNTDHRSDNLSLMQTERSLRSLGQLRIWALKPLTLAETHQLVSGLFRMEGPPVQQFGENLFGWTRGNPYFIEQTLVALVETGRLYQRGGTWLGWDAGDLDLPSTVSDAILTRFRGVGEVALSLAEWMAVVGSPVGLPVVSRLLDCDEGEILGAVEELVRRNLVEERERDREVVLDLTHPLTRETVYRRLGLTRRRFMHRQVAEAMEVEYGPAAEGRVGDLAYHFVHAGTPSDAGRAARYLVAAGREALARRADQEAAAYLESALDLLDRSPGTLPVELAEGVAAVRQDAARALVRCGHYDRARGLWDRLLATAHDEGDRLGEASAQRHLGLLSLWSGNVDQALLHYDASLECLPAGNPVLEIRLHLAAAVALQALGRSDDGRTRVVDALERARRLGDPGLLARVQRALALVSTWTGDAEEAHEACVAAVALAEEAGDEEVRAWSLWALASLEGLRGGPKALAPHLERLRSAAEALQSPVYRVWVEELELEYTYFTGDWHQGIARGERAITLADTLGQRATLVRLLVWTATIYLGRGDLERGRELVERAWSVAGLEEGRSSRRQDLHSVIPAHIGRAALYMAEGRYEAAIEVGREGLALARASNYVIWVLHRLLPILGEAYIRLRDMESARRVRDELRADGERMGHRLALAWADAADALITWQSGKARRGADMLRSAAEAMEERGVVPEAARLRRQLAGRLSDLGEREAALEELRRVHDVFAAMGAQPELKKARLQFKEMDSRPPLLAVAEGYDRLSARESEVARLLAERMSNKAIGKKLGITDRTVGTMITNINRKLGTRNRTEIGDRVREGKI